MPEEPVRQPLDLGQCFAALERPLALIESPEPKQQIAAYIDAARVHLERAMFDLLSSAVEAFNAAGGRARLQYEAGSLVLVVDRAPEGEQERQADEAEASDAEADEASPFRFGFSGDTEKVTIRLPRELKELIDRAAEFGGLSANSWYLRELMRAIRREVRRGWRGRGEAPPWQQRRRRGSSLKGFVDGQ